MIPISWRVSHWRRSAAREAHAEARLRAERDVGRRRHPLARHQRQVEPLRERGQDQGGLHHREGVADALAGTATEREVGEAGEPTGGVVGPALGTEGVGEEKIRRNAV